MKKGFTLIELLAVIVILTIIALIATPIILNIIEDAKENTLEQSSHMYKKAVEIALAKSSLDGIEIEDGTYVIDSDGNLSYGNKKIKVEIDNYDFEQGLVEIENNEIKNLNLMISDKILIDNNEKSFAIWSGGISEPKLENGEYLIYTPEELAWIAEQNNNGVDFTGITVKLMNNLDLGKVVKNGEIDYANSKNWIPIGTIDYPFLGIFDGNNYYIKNLYIKNLDSTLGVNQGLFGYISGNSIVRNIVVYNSYVNAYKVSGIIVGRVNDGALLENSISYNNQVILTSANAGAIAGQVSGTVQNCKSINDYIKGVKQVGAITGWIGNGLVQDCYSNSIVEGDNGVGGIVGITSPTRDNARVKNVVSYSSVTCLTDVCGGIAGYINGGYNFENIKSYATVEGPKWIGGIAGQAGTSDDYYGVIKNCESYSVVNVLENTGGGMFGNLKKELVNCYDNSIVTFPASATMIGGISGSIYNATVTNCQASTMLNNEKVTKSNILGNQVGTNIISDVIVK